MSEIVNKLICGDNIEELAKLPKESVELIYIDPPFFTQKPYEVVWGDEAEVRSFEDRWEGGIEHFISWLEPRTQLLWELLKPTGSFYIHCDWHANAHIRIMLDKIFGDKNFRNEIIWKRTHAHGSSNKFGPVHDTILFYSKSKDYIWTDSKGEHDPEYIANHFTLTNSDGRRFQAISLTGAGIRHGDSGQPWKGIDPTKVNRHWAIPGKVIARLKLGGSTVQEKLDSLDKAGRIYWPSKRGGTPRLKWYVDELEGPALLDLWTDISPISSNAAEHLGYPTQKPPRLLERIIKASSNKGDMVLDAFCGCGTACIEAQKLGRKWIGIDISPTAVKVIENQLKKIGVFKDKDYILIGAPTTATQLRELKPFEFQNWVINEMQAHHSKRKVGDMGLDGYIPKDLFREASGIQVKQSEGIGRNVVDNFKAALDRAKYKKGYIVAFSFGKGIKEETARLKNIGEVDIELVTVEDLLSKKVMLGKT